MKPTNYILLLPSANSWRLFAFALLLGTLGFTRAASAQSTYIITALQAAEGSTSTSGTYLLDNATTAELNAAVQAEATAANSTPAEASDLAPDTAWIMTNLKSVVTKGPTPPGDFGAMVAAIINGESEQTFAANEDAIVDAFANNLADLNKLTLAYDFGADTFTVYNTDSLIPRSAGDIAAAVTSQTMLSYYEAEIGIYAAYYPYSSAGDVGDVPLVSCSVANPSPVQPVQPVQPVSFPGLGVAMEVGVAYGEALQTGTFIESYYIATDGTAIAPVIAGSLAGGYSKYAPSFAAQATTQCPNMAPAVSATLTNLFPADAATISGSVAQAMEVLGNSTYAAATVRAIATAPGLDALPVTKKGSTITSSPDLEIEETVEQFIAWLPTQDINVSAAAAPSLTDTGRYTLAYIVAAQDAASGDLNDIPDAIEAIEDSMSPTDPNLNFYSQLISEYAAYPLLYPNGKTLNPITGGTATAVQIAIATSQATLGGTYSAASNTLVGGTYASAGAQASIAYGVVFLDPSIAITTSTAVEANALKDFTYLNAPAVTGTFAATFASETPYLAQETALYYPTQLIAGVPVAVLASGSAASAQPAQAALTGYEVALVTSTNNDVALLHAIDEAPGVLTYETYVNKKPVSQTDTVRETVAQDIIAAQPTMAVPISVTCAADLNNDTDRATFVFLLADQLSGVDEYFALPPGANRFNGLGDMAGVANAIASQATSIGSSLTSAEILIALYATYPFSSLDSGNKNPSLDEPYIPAIVNGVVTAIVDGSPLPIATQAAITAAMVDDYPAEGTGTGGIVALDLNTTLHDYPTKAPNVAGSYAASLYTTAYTYAPYLALTSATGQNPIIAGQVAAGVIGATQYYTTGKGKTLAYAGQNLAGQVAVDAASAATPVTSVSGTTITAAPNITLAQTYANDNLGYVAQQLALASSVSGVSIYAPTGQYTILNYFDAMISGSLASVVTGQYNRTAPAIANFFTNQLATNTYNAANAYYVEQIAGQTAQFDPLQAPDIVGYVIASIEAANTNNGVDGGSDPAASWNFINLKTVDPAILAAVEAALVTDGYSSTSAVYLAALSAYADITASNPATGSPAQIAQAAYFAGDFGVFTWNETPVVNY